MWRLHWRRAIFYSAITKRQHVSYIGKAWLESLRNVSLLVCACVRAYVLHTPARKHYLSVFLLMVHALSHIHKLYMDALIESR